MSFRKRNVVIGTPSNVSASQALRQDKTLALGVRPSPLDGRLTTSTGTSSLDQLLAGHSGLPLGTSVLVEEAGTTDFGGTLVRYYAAQGLVQGHQVHLLGFGDAWRRELPGIGSANQSSKSSGRDKVAGDDKMKIAWRYEKLGNATPRSTPGKESSTSTTSSTSTFCHAFDLSRRLDNNAFQGKLHTTPMGDTLARPSSNPLRRFIADVTTRIKQSSTSTIHRIAVPSLLSPTLYASSTCQPQEVLQFLHSLRALLRQYPKQVTAFVTIPVTLYPRSSGLTRMTELLFDSVLELIPLQHQSQMSREPGKEEKAQGLCRTHSLPIFHEKGGGPEGSWTREDLSFKLSASNGLVITPFVLPPVGEDEEITKTTKTSEGNKDTLEF